MSGTRPNTIMLKRQNSQLSEDEFEESSSIGNSNTRKRPGYLPSIWDEDVRMNALFTDFRARNVNPAAYDSKLKFWTDVITSCVEHEGLVTFTAAELRDKLQRKGRKPNCIAKVLEEMHRQKKFVTVDEFFSAAQESWVAWGFDSLVKKPLSWSAGLIFGPNLLDEKTRFVSLDAVRDKALDVIDRAQSGILPSSALDLATFKEVFGDIASGPEIPLVLKHLQRTQQAFITDLDDEEHATIKFLQKPLSGVREQGKRAATISEADRGMIALRRSLQKMENEASKLQTKIEELDQEVRDLVRTGKKPAAMRVLKKKKILEKALAQKDTVIENIGSMLFKLENSENDSKVFDAYKTGLSALKKTQQDTSLENIEGLVDDLQEAVDTQNEINEAMGSKIRGAEVDEDELERELEDLLANDATQNLINELENLRVNDNEPTKESSPNETRRTALKKETASQN